jgi:alpha-galactosidase
VFQGDAVSGLHVTSHLRVREGGSSLQSWTSVRNDGTMPLVLQAVSSLVIGRPVGTVPVADTLSLEGRSEWVGENRWAFSRLSDQDGLVPLDLPAHQHQDARGAHSLVSTGSWSSGRYNPSGVVLAEDGPALAWQVEHNGAWRAELGVRLDARDSDVLVLGLFGPTDDDHAWTRVLPAGESFESVPVSVAASDGWQESLAELTRHRRTLRRSPRRPVIVFNDYMNTLMGDPTTAKLLPLVDAAARAGAEYFCIDAGWYDDGGDWWDSVGLWEPSVSRFPDGGLRRVVDAIRAGGMVPGLWLEPDVVGVRSPLAESLPDEAFLQRHGVRVTEHGRHLLDLRHRDVIKHLDEVVDRLVEDFGVGYFKLDYNVTPGAGTDLDADSPGDGLLQQNRAHLDWIDGVLARHPDLVIENCASGAMRADYALLSRLDRSRRRTSRTPCSTRRSPPERWSG